MTTHDLSVLYLANQVRRWHANPVMAGTGQTIADHQCRATQLLLALHPLASPQLIWAVLHHDVGESVVGDLPQPFKVAFPDLAADHAAAETEALERVTGRDFPWLTETEWRWLKLVDRLEAAAFVAFHAPQEYERISSGWKATERDLLARAAVLLVLDPVSDLICYLRAGAW